jgi:hypothetical protein
LIYILFTIFVPKFLFMNRLFAKATKPKLESTSSTTTVIRPSVGSAQSHVNDNG